MNKKQLIDAMAKESGLTKKDAKKALDAFIKTTNNALKKGDRVTLMGFGSFAVAERKTRVKKQKTIEIEPFYTDKELIEAGDSLIQIFLDTSNKEYVEDFIISFYNTLAVYDLNVIKESNEKWGSWFKQLIVKAKKIKDSEQTKKKLEEINHAAKNYSINRVQAEIDDKKGNAIANMIKSIDSIKNVAIQLEEILLIKVFDDEENSTLVSITLTEDDYIKLKKNPKLLYNPRKLLEIMAANKQVK